jgi:hypothetical protein
MSSRKDKQKMIAPSGQRNGGGALGESDWQRLRNLSGLPDDARSDVEQVIRFLHEKPSLKNARVSKLQHDRTTIKTAKRKLRGALPSIVMLIESGAYKNLRSPLGTSQNNSASAVRMSRHEVVDFQTDMARFADLLAVTERHMPRARPGPHPGHFGKAIRWLNDIMLNATGAGLNYTRHRGSKVDQTSFVTTVCRIAGLTVKDSTVIQEIKEIRAVTNKMSGA